MIAERKRVAILISGRGSNMAALIEAAREPGYPAEIVGVISDRADASGLRIAESNGIPAKTIARSEFGSREAHDAAIDEELGRLRSEFVCLAGYMRLLSIGFVEKWQGRMINIHPSLLPLFKGLHPHRRALEAGMRVHGCTVHFVTAETDSGPIIAQAAVPVLTEDSEASLSARVLKAEHQLYPLALALVAAGKARMEGGRTVFDDLGEGPRSGAPRLVVPSSWEGPADIEDLARFTP